MKIRYIGIDCYGNTHPIKKFPRKELMEQLGASSAQKIYRDTAKGTQHVGYIISGIWIEVYEVHEWKVWDRHVLSKDWLTNQLKKDNRQDDLRKR